MICYAKKIKKIKAVIRMLEYSLDLIKAVWKQPRKQSMKLPCPAKGWNIPIGADPVKYIAGLVSHCKLKTNLLLSAVNSLPAGKVYSPAQFRLFNFLQFRELSRFAAVKQPGTKEFRTVDIEKDLAGIDALHANTRHMHQHCAKCLVHPITKRVVEINGGNLAHAVHYSLLKTQQALGQGVEIPYALGTLYGRPIVAPATHLNNGKFKTRAELIKEKKITDTKAAVAGFWSLLTQGKRWKKSFKLPKYKTSKATAIRGATDIVATLQEFFPDGPGFLRSKYPADNREALDRNLKAKNAGLKKLPNNGLVFFMDGAHKAAHEVDPRWTARHLELICGLAGETWCLGASLEEQNAHVEEILLRNLSRGTKQLDRTNKASVMCDFMRNIPKAWPQVAVDICELDNEWVHLGVFDVESLSVLSSDEPGFLNLAEIHRDPRFPLGTVCITPELPKEQLPLTLYSIPKSEIDSVMNDLNPAMIVCMRNVETGETTWCAMILIELLPEGKLATFNARLQLGHEYSLKYKCEAGVYGIPLAGLPVYPNHGVAKPVGRPHTYTSVSAQARLAETWKRIKAEEVAWWKAIPASTKQMLSDVIAAELAAENIPLSEILPQALANAKDLWQPAKSASVKLTPPTAPATQPPRPPKQAIIPPKKVVAPTKPTLVTEPTKDRAIQPKSVSDQAVTKEIQPPARAEELKPDASLLATPTPPKPKPAPTPVSKEIERPVRPASAAAPVENPPVFKSEEEEDRQRQLRRQLKAGLYLARNKHTEAECYIREHNLDELQADVMHLVWINLGKAPRSRVEALNLFLQRKSPEPEWLAAAIAAAETEQAQMLEKIRWRSPKGRIR